jgi:uracil-DNA glycosylase
MVRASEAEMGDPAVDMLQWYVSMGVNLPIDEIAHDRFAESAHESERERSKSAANAMASGQAYVQNTASAPPPHLSPAPRAPSSAAASALASPSASAVATEQAIARARELAQNAANLDQLRAALESFDGCGLKRTAHQLVFADGNPQAELIVIGDTPAADDDRSGLPFTGSAGHVLDRMLASIGYTRSTTYLINVVPWRPPGNRTPTSHEIAICLPFMQRHLELVTPKAMLCLGAVPLQAVINVRDAITRVRGQWFDVHIGQSNIPAMASLHPSFLLSQPAQKKNVWKDLRALKQKYPAPHIVA